MKTLRLQFVGGLSAGLLFSASLISAQEISILFTSNSNGAIENCHCPVAPLGGLEKRTLFIETYRRAHPGVLVVDGGDNFIDYHPPEVEAIITTAFRTARYDIINLGDQDIAYGTDEYFQLQPLMRDPAVPVTIKKDGITFSIMPVIHPAVTRFYPEFIFNDIDLEGQDDKIEAWLESVAPQSFRILLSHSGFDQDQLYARRFPEIDLIIGGHSQTLLDTLTVVNGVPIAQAGGAAAYIGEVRFTRSGGEYAPSHYQLHALTLDMPDHPKIIALVQAYKNGLRKKSH